MYSTLFIFKIAKEEFMEHAKVLLGLPIIAYMHPYLILYLGLQEFSLVVDI